MKFLSPVVALYLYKSTIQPCILLSCRGWCSQLLLGIFLNWDSVYVMLKNHYNAWGYKKKNCKKIKTYTGNVFRKNLYLKVSVNSRLNVFQMIGQRKAFYRQRISESSCVRKEIADIDNLKTYRNGHGKIMQSVRIMSRPPSRIRKWNQSSQFR